jgi:signal transduction histidine kinase
MTQTPANDSPNLDALADLLRRMLRYSIFAMLALLVLQLLLVLPALRSFNPLGDEWVLFFAATACFTLTLLWVRRLAHQRRTEQAVQILFTAIGAMAIVQIIFFPFTLGLAVIELIFALIIALPYVSDACARAMRISTVVQGFLFVPIAALMSMVRPMPTPASIILTSLPLFLVIVAMVLLVGQLRHWLLSNFLALRDARNTLEANVNARTSELQTANQSLRRQAAYLDTLHQTTLAVMNRMDKAQLLHAIITHACKLLGVEHGVISLLDPDRDYLTTDYTRGYFRRQELELGHKVIAHRGEGAIGFVWESGQPLRISDYAHWSGRLGEVRPDAFKGAIIVPLKQGDELIGILAVANDAWQPDFTDEDLDLLCRYAQMVSIAIDNSMLLAAARTNEQVLEQRVADRTGELSTLLGVAQNLSATLDLPSILQMIFEQLDALVEFDAGAIFEVQDDQMLTLHYTGPDHDHSKAGVTWPLTGHHLQIVRTGQPLLIRNTRSDEPAAIAFREVAARDWLGTVPAHIVSWIGVPMKVKDRVIGILTLDSAQPDHFTQRHVALLMAVGQQAAMAMENARLYEQASHIAAQAERSRLARDLHDSVSQAIYGIVLASRTLEKLSDGHHPRMAAPLQHILSLSDAAMAEIRALIFELRPESLAREGILAALNKQADAVRARYGLQVEADLCPTEPAIPLALKEAIYRIALEAMHNAVKHAQARRLCLKLACAGNTCTLEVLDDGAGFDVNSALTGQMGLGTMRERAQAVGGRLDVWSAPGHGTTIRAVLPLPALVPAAMPA